MKRFVLLLFFLIPILGFSQQKSIWFEVTEVSYWQDGKGHDPLRVKFRMNMDTTPTRYTCGTIVGYTDQRFILTLKKEVEHTKNREGDIFKWTFVDGHENKGICSLHWNNNSSIQLVLEFSDHDAAVIYNMHLINIY